MPKRNLLFLIINIFILTASYGVVAQDFNSTTSNPMLSKISFANLPEWNHAKASIAMQSLKNSCNINKQSAPKAYGLNMDIKDWNKLCRNIFHKNINEAKQVFEQYFDVYKVGDEQRKGLLTGYYTPLLNGSFNRDANHLVPIYALPKSSAHQTAFNRKQIDEGALIDKAEVIMWLDDEIEAFFLHIQGSGFVRLTDGSIKKLVFAGKNQFPYTAIGKQFVEQKLVSADEISMQWLKNWLRTHSEHAKQVMQTNQSYIFFALENMSKSVRGAENAPLTPLASIAIDPQYIDYGLPVYIDATLKNGKNFSTLAIAQDTGSAIRGALRADLYTGVGIDAGDLAGGLKASADFYLLYPKI
jgi:membrane-bound lytic murein transglycosylase A